MQCRTGCGLLLGALCHVLSQAACESLRGEGGRGASRAVLGAGAFATRSAGRAGGGSRHRDDPQGGLQEVLTRIFRCRPGDTGADVFGLHASLSQAFVVLAGICLVAGLAADSYVVAQHYELRAARSLDAWWRLRRLSSLIELRLICACSLIGHFMAVLADVNIFVGFAYCGFWHLFIVFGVLKAISQSFLAYEYAHSYADDEQRGPTKRFLTAAAQLRPLQDMRDSISRGQLTHSFIRQNFLDAICDQAPQAIFITYVMYAMDQCRNVFLLASIVCKVVSTSYAIATWLSQSLQEQLNKDLRAAAEASAQGAPLQRSPSRRVLDAAKSIAAVCSCDPTTHREAHTAEVAVKVRAVSEQAVKWYHKCVWICYFATDFGLRLLTLGLFLSKDGMLADGMVFVGLIATYSFAVAVAVGTKSLKEMDRTRIQHRIIDALIITFFVNVLPADIRRPPQDSEESRIMMSFAPDVRERLLWVIIFLRAADYVALGALAMWARYDGWQCAALSSLFVTMHILLASVLVMQQRMSRVYNDGHQAERPSDM